MNTRIAIISLLGLFLYIGDGSAQCLFGDCRNGYGEYVFKGNAGTYEGTFKQGLPNGQGLCRFSNGDVYKGEWLQGKFHGHGRLSLADGTELLGQWKNGQYQGATSEIIEPDSKAQEGQQVWALVVGVSDYHHMPALRYADDDAYQIHNFLLAAEGMALPSTQVSFLLNESATRQNILNALDRLARQADADDLILFYFSGHGLKGSFLPFDYDGFNNQVFHNEINNALKPSRAAHRICIADACHSGSQMAARDAEVSWIQEWYPVLLEDHPALTFFLSSKSSERSLESAGLRMGVFSHFLIRGLRGEADVNQDVRITLAELYDYVSQAVREYTGQQQHPLLAGDYDPDLVLK